MTENVILIDFPETVCESLQSGSDFKYVMLTFDELEREPVNAGGHLFFICCSKKRSFDERIRDLRRIFGFERKTLVACLPDGVADCGLSAYISGADYVLPQGLVDIDQTRKISKELIAPPLDDIPYARAFIDSASEVISVMAGMEAYMKDVYLTFGKYLLGDISGLMRLSGTSEGRLALSFDEITARRLIAAVLGVNIDELSRTDIEDGVYEAVNVIGGNAKAKLAGTAHHFEISTPRVIRGNLLEFQQDAPSKTLVVLFEISEGGKFALEICLGQSKKYGACK